MSAIQYYSHLLLNSKYSFIIKLAIFLGIYILFYVDNTQDIVYCVKKTGVKKIAKATEIAQAVEAPDIATTATPFIAESKDEVIHGFQNQLRTMEMEAKKNQDDLRARLDEIKRIQIGYVEPSAEEKNPYVETLLRKNHKLVEEKQELISKLKKSEKVNHDFVWGRQIDREQERAGWFEQRTALEKQNRELIQNIQEMRKVNRALAQTVTEQDQYTRQLTDVILPGEIPTMESKSTQTGVNYPNERFRHATQPRIYRSEGICDVEFGWDPENQWYKEETKNTDPVTNVQQYIQQNCNIS